MTYFLAQFFGIYFFIVAVAMLVHTERFVSLSRDMMSSPGLMFFSSLMTLAFGTALIISHNVWMLGWPVLITLLCWITFLKAVALLFFPSLADWSNKLLSHSNIRIAAVFYLCFGAVLFALGYGII